MHWLNAVAMLILILSGWAIYNDEVIFGRLHFPSWMTLGDGPEGALQWHFLAMWILGINGLAYLAYGLATGRFRRMLLPIRVREVIAEIRSALALRLSHEELTRYNAVQRLLYIGVIFIGILQVLSGLTVWKPVQFSELATLFGEFQNARLVHFLGMAAIVGFLIVHVALALIVPRTLVAMVTGGPFVARDPTPGAEPVPSDDGPREGDRHADPKPMEAGLPAAPAEAIAEPIAEPQPSQDRPEQIEP
jgi:thiosulfate reductase cytochrome b subunit